MTVGRTLISAACAILGAVEARAQTASRWSLQASALYATIGADAFDDLGNGPGAEGQIRMTRGALSVGAGMQLTRHPFDSDIIGDLNLFGVFLEPRWVIALATDRYAPYVAGRLSYLRGNIDGDIGTVESRGAQFNGGGGVLVSLTRRANLDVGATYGRISFGRITKSIDGEEFEEEGGSGGNLVVRVGLAVGLGR